MVYRTIGVWSDQFTTTIVFSEFLENAGIWSFEIKADKTLVSDRINLGKLINQFIKDKGLQFGIALISIHVTDDGSMINGGAIAAETGLRVITDLASMDIALGGNGEFFEASSSRLQMPNGQLSDINKTACVAFMGILRWREEYNFLSSVTGASRNSIGGALWMGQEA